MTPELLAWNVGLNDGHLSCSCQSLTSGDPLYIFCITHILRDTGEILRRMGTILYHPNSSQFSSRFKDEMLVCISRKTKTHMSFLE